MKKTVTIMAALVLLAGVGYQLRAQDTTPDTNSSIKQQMSALLKANSPRRKAKIAAEMIAQAIESSEGETPEVIAGKLAKLTAALIGAAGPDAPGVAAAIIKAGSPQFTTALAAAIATAAPVTGTPDAVIDAALGAVQGPDAEAAAQGVQNANTVLGDALSKAVLETASQFRAIWEQFVITPGDTTTTTTSTTTTTTEPSVTEVGKR